MIKLNYPSKRGKWQPNDLEFSNWEEYWKSIGYLSNQNVHRWYNPEGDIDIVLEMNALSNSYTNTPRIYYYGNEESFNREFPSLYAIHRGALPGSNAKFRINRKEFGESLIYDLGFRVVEIPGKRDSIIIPLNRHEMLNRINCYDNFMIDSWNEGYNLGSLM